MSTIREALAELLNSDHKRGCGGRMYSCTCGYDEALYKAASALATADEQTDAARFVFWFQSAEKQVDINEYLRGCREHWTLDQWRAFVDSEMSRSTVRQPDK